MAANRTLVIGNVDLDLLEDQRQRLNRAFYAAADGCPSRLELGPDQVDALVGVLGMLDAWSDERSREQEGWNHAEVQRVRA